MYNFYDGGEGLVEGEADVEVCDALHSTSLCSFKYVWGWGYPWTVAVDMMKASSLAISYVPPTRNTRWWWDVPGCGSKRSPCFKISLLAPDIFGSWEYTRWAPNQYGTSLKLINWPLTATRETMEPMNLSGDNWLSPLPNMFKLSPSRSPRHLLLQSRHRCRHREGGLQLSHYSFSFSP